MHVSKTEDEVRIDGHKITLSNVEKILFPGDKSDIPKAALIEYYFKIAPYMLPHLKDRPISMQRYPNGITEQGFFQKEAPDYFPDYIDRVEVELKEGEFKNQLCINNRATLAYLATQGVITTHIWLSCKDHIDKPDRLVIDLDPSKEGEFNKIIRSARCLKKLYEEIGFEPYVMTTGSRGLHVTVAIKPEEHFKQVREFAEQLSRVLVRRWPKDLTLEVRKNKRHDRIFVDTLRNAYAQTAVAPYSVRPKPNAPIATPIDWDELGDIHSQKYNIGNIFRRMGQKEDPWKDIGKNPGSLTEARKKLTEIDADVC